MMKFINGYLGQQQDIYDLFTTTFSDSEGSDEGGVIGKLVLDLMENTQIDDISVTSAYDNQTLVGCTFFSRLTYDRDNCIVFIMSPVAVKTDRQKTGIGQKLIVHGLNALQESGVDYVVTYGDPSFYSKTGFSQITEEKLQPPFKLSLPEGWLGQPLSKRGEKPIIGPARCVTAFNDPEYW